MTGLDFTHSHHRTQGLTRLIIHRSLQKSTGLTVPKLIRIYLKNQKGPLDLFITKLAGSPGNSMVGTSGAAVKLIHGMPIMMFTISRIKIYYNKCRVEVEMGLKHTTI